MRIIPDEDPQDPRVFIPNIEFYITNVCNLSCENCNRFNNYDFKGWQRWSDHEVEYAEWAKKIRLQRITILGGEPLLNPSICDWVDGINNLWGKPVQVLTNGTRLNHVPELYDRMTKFCDPVKPWIRNWIGVSLHNENDRARCFEEIRKFLRGDIVYYHKDDPTNVNNCHTMGADHVFWDSNGMKICVWEYNSFYSAAIQKNSIGKFSLFNNDPAEAHRLCGFAMYKCYHFINAKIYKCGPVALFPEFDEQYQFDISEADRELINSYKPLCVQEFDQKGRDFLKHIDDVIPQCKFCPTNEKNANKRLIAISKKKGATSSFD